MASQALADYYLEKAYRRAGAMPQSVQALPDLGEITLQGVAAKAAAAGEAEGMGQELSLAQQRLDERARQATERLGLQREELRAGRKGNVWATGIGLANLALTGMGGAAQIKEAEKQEDFYAKLLAQREEIQGIKQRQFESMQGMMPSFLESLQGGSTNWWRRMRPTGTMMST
jgi:hypothetical protein